MFTDIYHIGYLTEDNAAAISFYESSFGARVVSQATSADGKTKLAFLQVGNTEIEFIEAPDRVRAAGKGSILLDHVGYCVADINSAVAGPRGKGIGFASDAPYRNPLGDRLIYLDSATTNGVRMHLTQRQPS